MLTKHTDRPIQGYEDLLLYVDGGCEPKNPGGVSTCGWVLYDRNDLSFPLVEQSGIAMEGGPTSTNNTGEYTSLVLALTYLSVNEWRGELCVRADSKLLVEQVCQRWKCNLPHLQKLRQKIFDLLGELDLVVVTKDNPLPPEEKKSVQLEWIEREKNQRANDLCRLAYQDYLKEKKKHAT